MDIDIGVSRGKEKLRMMYFKCNTGFMVGFISPEDFSRHACPIFRDNQQKVTRLSFRLPSYINMYSSVRRAWPHFTQSVPQLS